MLVAYDYEEAARRITPADLRIRPHHMWRYRELLPVLDDDNIVTLGEGGTPLLHSRVIGEALGMPHLYFKDESGNPTGSFKARGLGMAVSRAKELGLNKLIIPTAGNAGTAVAAYAARAGMRACVIMPEDSPLTFMLDCRLHGAEVELVKGTIADCGAVAAEKADKDGWFSVATLKEPYRIEGKKTLGYELAEQFDYDLPDVIVYPTGGGTGLIGMWKAFIEMEQMGWVGGRKPAMVAVQASGCAPIPRAWENGESTAAPWENAQTVAAGLRVPGAIGDFLILDAVKQSGGVAVAVSDRKLIHYTGELAAREGIFSSPEGGAALAALVRLVEDGSINPDRRVVVFITGTGYKYMEAMETILSDG